MIGESVLVMRGATTLLAKDTGRAYQIASVSKQFTAAAVLLLTGRGTLALDDPLERWTPCEPAACWSRGTGRPC
jgi:CubicO group peptidase (beta-lactamase class C family)